MYTKNKDIDKLIPDTAKFTNTSGMNAAKLKDRKNRRLNLISFNWN